MIADIPEFKDEGFIKDRTEYAGRTFHPDVLRQMRPEALVGMRAAFRVLEDVLEDGRDWLLGTEKPNLADIEGMSSISCFGDDGRSKWTTTMVD